MKAITLSAAMAALLCGGAVGAASAGESAPAPAMEVHEGAPMAPMSPLGECMRAGKARDWGLVDARRMVVRTWDGRYYDLGLMDDCPAAEKKAFLALLESRMSLRDGRICGDVGDAVLPVSPNHDRLHDHPCRIATMRRIDADTFEGVFGKSPEEGVRFLDAAPDYVPTAEVAAR